MIPEARVRVPSSSQAARRWNRGNTAAHTDLSEPDTGARLVTRLKRAHLGCSRQAGCRPLCAQRLAVLSWMPQLSGRASGCVPEIRIRVPLASPETWQSQVYCTWLLTKQRGSLPVRGFKSRRFLSEEVLMRPSFSCVPSSIGQSAWLRTRWLGVRVPRGVLCGCSGFKSRRFLSEEVLMRPSFSCVPSSIGQSAWLRTRWLGVRVPSGAQPRLHHRDQWRLAQMEERSLDTAEALGSIPRSPTHTTLGA